MSDASEEIKEHKSRVMDAHRRKKLMKKLEKIKLNRSRGNNSFVDIGAIYESRVIKLKNNNISLAKALAEQRQVSQTWYSEVISMKEELQETQEVLLRYRLNENGNCDAAIQAAAERRIKDIAEPLEMAVKDSVDNVFSLVESITKVKQLLSSLLKVNSEKFNYSRSSRGSSGSRPPLSRTPKSPRKNVVHPMVEGHVLQPASIHIPRMSLGERRRYRLQDRAEIREEEGGGMDVIGEASRSIIEQSPEVSLVEADPEEEVESGAGEPESEEVLSEEVEPVVPIASPVIPVPVVEEVAPVSPQVANPSPSKKKRKQRKVVDIEDPLEGSSWMHTKKRKSYKKRARGSAGANLKRSSGMHFISQDSSDESDEDYYSSFQSDRKISPKRIVMKKDAIVVESPCDDSNTILPTLCLVRLEELDSKVSRRSKRSRSSARHLQASVNDVVDHCEPVRSVPLQSFIINDTLSNDSDETFRLHFSDASEHFLQQDVSAVNSATTPTMSLSPTLSFSTPPSPIMVNFKEEEEEGRVCKPYNDATCLFDSSMEMTQCLTKGPMTNIIEDEEGIPLSERSVPKLCDDGASDDNQIKVTRYEKKKNRFFKGFEKEDMVKANSPFTKTPYNLSMMETSVINALTLNNGKENIPPEMEDLVQLNDSFMKLKDVSVVVEDFMKTPSVTPEVSRHCSPSSDKEEKSPLLSKRHSGNASPIKSVPTKKGKKQKKPKEKVDSPISNGYVDQLDYSMSNSESGDDNWSPSVKFKTKKKRAAMKKSMTVKKSLPKRKSRSANMKQLHQEIDPSNQKPLNTFLDIFLRKSAEMNRMEEKGTHEKEKCIPVKKIVIISEEGIDADDENLEESLEQVMALVENTLETKKVKKEHPSASSKKRKENEFDLPDLTDDPQIDSKQNIWNTSTEENVKSRPRRAACKVVSFKEPSLNMKLRQENKSNQKKCTKKKSSKS